MEQELIGLGWHQKEYQRRSSFDDVSCRPTRRGCSAASMWISRGYGAEVWLRVRASELAAGLDDVLCATVRRWINKRWPFARVADPGRELRWDSVRRPGGPGTPRAG